MKVVKCHFGSKYGKCLVLGWAFWNFEALTLEESTVGWVWPCTIWPPYNQVGWKWPSLEITSQGAESASWMKVAIPSLASTSNLNHNYETYDAGGFQYSLSIKMFLQHKYFLSIVVNTKYFTQVVVYLEISWPLSPNKVISYSERQNLRMATFHFHPTRSFCTVRDKHWEWPLSSNTFIPALWDGEWPLSPSKVVVDSEGLNWGWPLSSKYLILELIFHDGHFHPTWLFGGQMVQCHIQPTVDSSKVKASKFENALPETRHFPFRATVAFGHFHPLTIKHMCSIHTQFQLYIKSFVWRLCGCRF